MMSQVQVSECAQFSSLPYICVSHTAPTGDHPIRYSSSTQRRVILSDLRYRGHERSVDNIDLLTYTVSRDTQDATLDCILSIGETTPSKSL